VVVAGGDVVDVTAAELLVVWVGLVVDTDTVEPSPHPPTIKRRRAMTT
jgi:hypothetical protein